MLELRKMSNILRFLINGKCERLVFDDRHPTFSFVIDFEKEGELLDRATLIINNHQIDVSKLTHYRYEFDDLKPLTNYEACLEVIFNDHNEKKIINFETGLFSWDAHFISDPNYTFKEKRPDLSLYNDEINHPSNY